jgi:uncharacterized protein YbjT (DUF2867 family)
MIATRDIAAVAADILAAPTFTGRSFRELLGPRDYSPREITKIIGEGIGRPDLPHVEFRYEDALKGMIGAGVPEDLGRLYIEMNEGFNEGRVAPIQGRRPETTTPTTFETFVADTFAPAFRK